MYIHIHNRRCRLWQSDGALLTQHYFVAVLQILMARESDRCGHFNSLRVWWLCSTSHENISLLHTRIVDYRHVSCGNVDRVSEFPAWNHIWKRYCCREICVQTMAWKIGESISSCAVFKPLLEGIWWRFTVFQADSKPQPWLVQNFQLWIHIWKC